LKLILREEAVASQSNNVRNLLSEETGGTS
jgi:hypothetical protein